MSIDVSEFFLSTSLANGVTGTGLAFRRSLDGHLLAFSLVTEGAGPERTLYIKSLIDFGDIERWKSFEDMLRFSLRSASVSVQGMFGYELLWVDLDSGIRNFETANFGALIANHAANLKPMESRLVRYTSVYGILQKRVPEDWGKIDLKTHVSVYRRPPEKMDLFVKETLKDLPAGPGSVLVFHDLSGTCLLQRELEDQAMRMSKMLRAMKAGDAEEPHVLYWHHRGKTVELAIHDSLK